MSTVTVASAIDLGLRLAEQLGRLSILIRAANAEGRGTLTTEEWEPIVDENDAAWDEVRAEIARAKAEGR